MKVIYMPLFKEHYGVKVMELDHRKLQNIFYGGTGSAIIRLKSDAYGVTLGKPIDSTVHSML